MKTLFFLLVVSCHISYAQNYSLALNLEKGHNYYLGFRAMYRIAGEMDGQKINMQTAMNGRFKCKVISASPEGYEMEVSFDSVDFVFHGPGGKMELSYPDESIIDSMQNSKHIFINVLKNGAVVNIKNPDTAGIEAMLHKIPMLMMLKNMIGHNNSQNKADKKTMHENRMKMTAIFPDKKVGINDTWENNITRDSSSRDALKMKYKLVGYNNGIASIEKQTIITGRDLSGNITSSLQIDASTGWIKQGTEQSNFKAGRKGEIVITGNATISGW